MFSCNQQQDFVPGNILLESTSPFAASVVSLCLVTLVALSLARSSNDNLIKSSRTQAAVPLSCTVLDSDLEATVNFVSDIFNGLMCREPVVFVAPLLTYALQEFQEFGGIYRQRGYSRRGYYYFDEEAIANIRDKIHCRLPAAPMTT